MTLIFVVMQYVGNTDLLHRLRIDSWDPSALAKADEQTISRVSTGFEFFANFLTLLVLLDAGGLRSALLNNTVGKETIASSTLVLTSAWQPLYIAWIVACAIVSLGAVILYIRPNLVRLRLVAHATSNLIVVAGVAISLRTGALVAATSSAISAADLAKLNMVLSWTIAAIAIGAGLAAIFAIRKLIRPAKRRVVVAV